MKKICIPILLVLFIWSCTKNDNPISPSDTELYGKLNNALLNEINLMRSNPAAYATLLESTEKNYNGKLYTRDDGLVLMTTEGLTAVREAVASLRNVSGSLRLYSLSNGLCKACYDHVKDIGPKGLTQHIGSDNSDPGVRMSRYGTVSSWGECIAFGLDTTARQFIFQLLVDDGVPDRGHRKIMLDPKFKIIGFGFGPHSVYNYMCVIDFADSYIEKTYLTERVR